MNKVRIKLHSAGVRALLKGAEMQNILKEQAAAVAARCGDGYEYRTDVAQKRAVADIYPATPRRPPRQQQAQHVGESLK